jgi:transcription elongation factor SPT5
MKTKKTISAVPVRPLFPRSHFTPNPIPIENGFIEQDVYTNDRPQDVRAHRRLDRIEAQDMSRDAREIARELRERYRRDLKTYDGSANFSDRKANMPGPGDPKLWQVKCKSGAERTIVNTILMRGFYLAEQGTPLLIYSAFQRDSLPGLIFVEADKAQHAQEALTGISNVYMSTPRSNQAKNNPIQLVENRDMVSLLTMKKKVTSVKKGMWVRVKRGKYAGDLAQVNDVQPDGMTAAVLLVPRIDYEPDARTAEDRKRKKGVGAASAANRPPQRLFSHEAVQERFGRGAAFKKSGRWIFKDEEYTGDGLLDKEYPITSLQTEDVHPTLTEIAKFGGDDLSAIADKNAATSVSINLDALAEQSRRAAGSNVQPGDRVEATEGELAGMRGIVEAVSGEVVTIRPTDIETVEGEKEVTSVELAGKSVKKIFSVGDHVKVTHGRNQDDTGMVLRIDGNTVTYLSDLTQMEVSCGYGLCDGRSWVVCSDKRLPTICERPRRSVPRVVESVNTKCTTWSW